MLEIWANIAGKTGIFAGKDPHAVCLCTKRGQCKIEFFLNDFVFRSINRWLKWMHRKTLRKM